ncbi:MAG: aminoacyl-tRNA hydrolase [bacterium]
MFLIVGLGNPGKKYEKTRHNIGARIISELKPLNFKGIILAGPTTFMNESGRAVKLLIKNLKLEIKNLIVVHDDIDLPLGEFKIQKNRGAAGHKGVESIIKELGTKNFIRFRVGIKPKLYHELVHGTKEFVLQKFSKDEEGTIKEIIKKTAEAIEMTIKDGLEKAMNLYNK